MAVAFFVLYPVALGTLFEGSQYKFKGMILKRNNETIAKWRRILKKKNNTEI